MSQTRNSQGVIAIVPPFEYCDVEVVRNSDGLPLIRLLKEKDIDFRLSLSYGNGSAIASVIALKK